MTYTEQFSSVYEELEKAMRDRSHLTMKIVTDKNGHQRKVWVRPDAKNVKKTVKKTEPDNEITDQKIVDKFNEMWESQDKDEPGVYAISLLQELGLPYEIESFHKMENALKKNPKIKFRHEAGSFIAVGDWDTHAKNSQKKEEPKKDMKLPDNFYSYSKEIQDEIKNTKYAIAIVSHTNDFGVRTTESFKVAVAVPKDGIESIQRAAHNAIYGHRGSGNIQLKSIKELSPKEFEKEINEDISKVAKTTMNQDRYENILSEVENDDSNIMNSYISKEEVAEQQSNAFLKWLERKDLYKTPESGDEWFDYHKKEATKWVKSFNKVIEHPDDYSESTIKSSARNLNESIGEFKAALYIKKYGLPTNTDNAIKWYNDFNINDALPEIKDYVSKDKIPTDMKKSYSDSFADAYEDLQKAIRDRSHLMQKQITDKNGHRRTVWVKTEEKKVVTR